MKKIILLFTLLISITGKAQTKDAFIGQWATEEGKLVIEIYTKNSSYYAKIKTCENPEIKDEVVLIQMKKKSNDKLYGGTYYDDELKSEYEAKLKLIDKNTIRLKVLYGLFNKIIIWHRVNPSP